MKKRTLEFLQGRITCSIWFVLSDTRRVTDDIRICYTNSLPVVVMITVRPWLSSIMPYLRRKTSAYSSITSLKGVSNNVWYWIGRVYDFIKLY